MDAAAVAGAGLIVVVIGFQVALVAGAPWGQAAWGGAHAGQLPTRLRAASAIAVVVLVLLAWILLAAAGLANSPIPESWLDPAAWVAAGYFVIGAVVNLISRSRIERIWSPVALLTAVCYGIVAAG